MRIVMKLNRGMATLVAAALGVFALASVASADVTTEQSGSIVVWPKVMWTGVANGRDTVIRLANTGNTMVHALCFYINAAPVFPIGPDGACLPPGPSNPPQWNEIDFEIWLSRQQPTHWVASSGRRVNFTSPFGSDEAGLDPGLVPPVPLCFQGELKCVQVDDSGTPLRGNKLKGEATLRRADGDVSTYNAISILGNPDPGVQTGPANHLALNHTAASPGEYNACPDTLTLNHFAYGVTDPILNSLGLCGAAPNNCPIRTDLTLVPCQQDLENQIPGRVTVQFQVFNEFEQPFSTSTTVDCWLNGPLNTLGTGATFTFGVLGTTSAYTRINPNPGHGGVIGIAEELRQDGTLSAGAWAAFNIHTEGNRFDAATDGKGNPVAGVTDHIVIPLHD